MFAATRNAGSGLFLAIFYGGLKEVHPEFFPAHFLQPVKVPEAEGLIQQRGRNEGGDNFEDFSFLQMFEPVENLMKVKSG